MPPPLEDVSDDESTGGSIPYNNNENVKEEQEGPEGTTEGLSGENEADDDEEGVYVVESVVGHDFAKDGTLLLQVKWKGYEDPADQTLEPEENLMEGAQDLVEEYYRAQGGRPQKPAPKKRKSAGKTKQTPEKAEPKRQRKPKSASKDIPNEADMPDWVPAGKNWDNEVLKVDTIMRIPESEDLFAYLHWNNGRKSKVSVETCYDRCPKKMLRFYEQHLVFKD